MGGKVGRSPLRAKPWRNPGQSLDEEIERVIYEEIASYVMTGVFVLLLVVLEWYRWWADTPYQPVLYTVLAIAFLGFIAYRSVKVRRKLQLLKQGRDGEKAVGQYLESLRADGSRIFHDVVADGFNIDHVIIAPQGIFAVETKTISKPVKGKALVRVEGDRLLVDGYEPDRNPMEQVIAEADWLQGTLHESTGKRFTVRGIVLFPGWWVEGKPQNRRVWVLNPRALPSFLKNEREALSEADVNLAAFHLSRYIRAG